MNYLLALCILFVSLVSSGQSGAVTMKGFREIKIGEPLNSVEKYLKPTTDIPQYAWFATPEFDYFKNLSVYADSTNLSQEDSLNIIYEMEMSAVECEGQTYIPHHKDYQKVHGFSIAAMKICVDERKVISAIYIVLDKKNINAETKDIIRTLFGFDLGISSCEESIISSTPPFPFYCSEYDGEIEAVISDMYKESGGFGESINIAFR